MPDGRHVVSLGCAATQGSNGQHWDLLPFSTVGHSALEDASLVMWPWQDGAGSKHSIDPAMDPDSDD